MYDFRVKRRASLSEDDIAKQRNNVTGYVTEVGAMIDPH